MEKEQIHGIVEKQKKFFDSGATKSVDKRIEYLKKIKEYIIKSEELIAAALKADLGKKVPMNHICVK